MNKKVIAFIFIASTLLLIASLTSEMSLGDETHNYRFAKGIYSTGKRITHDPLYPVDTLPQYYFITAPLWHFLLAMLWKLGGGISVQVAKFYHTIYYALLIYFVYLLGKQLYGRKEGLYSAVIVATVPMVVSFSILFYIDVPVTALGVLCLLLIAKQRYFWAGISLGLMYLTKINAVFFIPAIAFLVIYYSPKPAAQKIKNLFKLFLPAGCFMISDIYWRYFNLAISVASLKSRLIEKNWKIIEFLNSSLANPMDVVKYFGAVLAGLLILYFVYRRREKKDIFLWAPIISYLVFYIYIFNFGSDIRYVMPIVPLLVILASKPVVFLNKKWLQTSVALACFLQLIAASSYVNIMRRIPQDIKAGFKYIKENSPANSLIMYPEENLMEATERRIIWSSTLYHKNLFWPENSEEENTAIKFNKIDYIVIKKSRIYDDTKVQHFGGYPKSFVLKLRNYDFLQLVFSNNLIDVWKVK